MKIACILDYDECCITEEIVELQGISWIETSFGFKGIFHKFNIKFNWNSYWKYLNIFFFLMFLKFVFYFKYYVIQGINFSILYKEYFHLYLYHQNGGQVDMIILRVSGRNVFVHICVSHSYMTPHLFYQQIWMEQTISII